MASADPFSLDGADRIPDPAAHVARLPVPPAAPPAEPAPTRDGRRRLARAVIAGACLWVAAAVAAFGVRRDIAAPVVLAPLAAWAATIALGLAIVLRPRARGLPAPVRVVQHAIWLVPAIFAAVVLGVGGGSGGPPLAWATIRPCLGIAGLVAVGPIAAAAVLLRRSFLSASAWRGAAVGALTGLAGSLGVHAHCPVPALDHLLAAHGPVIVIGALLGALFGRARGSA